MWNCNELQPAVELRSDIENVWTLVIFFAPSCLAVAALLVQYLFLYMPFAQATSRDINPVDVVILQWFRGALGYLDRPSRGHGFRAVFDQFMLSLGDIHTGFGIAIIGYGFASVSRGFAAYDWWLMVGLAWLSVITNLAVVSCLRDFFPKHPAKRAWRLCLVVTMVAMLAVCMVPIVRMRHAMSLHGQESRHDILAANVLCFFPGRGHDPATEGLGQFMLSFGCILGFIVIMVALAITVIILERPEGILRKWCIRYRGDIREISTGDQALCARCEQRFVLLVMRPFVALWLTIRTHLDLLNSVLAEVTCTIALFVWITLRLSLLLQLQPLPVPENLLTFAHFIAFVTLLAPLKPLVECLCLICRKSQVLISISDWVWRREPVAQCLPASEDRGAQTGKERIESFAPQIPGAPDESRPSQGRASSSSSSRRRVASTTPMHFKFYLDTAWYVKALPIAGVSALVQLVLLFVLSMVGGKPAVEVVSQTAPWFVIFAPGQVLLFILSAMVTEERGGTTERKRWTYWGVSILFGVSSIAAALDTIYGLGGYPMSYIGMAAFGLVVIAYVLYGCISKPGSFGKGKGTNSGEVDEESALLGSKPQAKIPVRRPKHLHGPSRRLSKQGIKNYGTVK